MNKPKVSIIIPAYNEEKYLERCLTSVISQTLTDIEIIIVDDCSTDNTYNICEKWKENFPEKITVIHKKTNEGLGLARNTGIKVSKGDYIGFVDSDDWIESSMYEQMYLSAINNNSEIVICDVRKIFVSENRESVEISLPEETNHVNIGNFIKDGKNPAYSWNKLYKREIWEKYAFKKMVYEDLDIILIILSNCKNISYVQQPFNTYFKRQGSITTSYTNIRLLDIMQAYKDAVYFCNRKYAKQVEFCVAKRILINMETPGFIFYQADFIELLQELNKTFKKNTFIKKNKKVSSVFSFTNKKIIPKNIYILEKLETNKFIAKLEKTIRNYSLIKLSSKELIIKNLIITGGIYITSDFDVSFPLGEVRSTSFFLIINKNNNKLEATGGIKEAEYLKEFFFDNSFNIKTKQNFIIKEIENHKILMLY